MLKKQTGLERQDLPCTYLAHHKPGSTNNVAFTMALVAEYWIGTLVPAP